MSEVLLEMKGITKEFPGVRALEDVTIQFRKGEIHALVGDGKHGQAEHIQTFRCQACRTTFAARRDTPLYRLKTPSQQVAMVLTAISYGRMAALYPSAGSAYTYVGRGLHPYLGFVSGWAMLLDYVVSPLFCVIYGSLALQRAIPALPYPVCAAMFAGGITYLNLRGIRSTARANQVLILFMFAVLLSYIVLAIRYLLAQHGVTGLFSIKPFYNPATFNVRDIAGATSFAALTYLGFDAVTTLAEDVKNPRRNVMLAAVGVCAFTGIFGGLLVYLAQLAWPDYNTFSNIETAFI